MSIYVKIGKKILKNPKVVNPHLKVKDISYLNFAAMKRDGMKKIIYNIDGVITPIKQHQYINNGVERAFYDSLREFGDENVMILSNMSHHRYKYSYYC